MCNKENNLIHSLYDYLDGEINKGYDDYNDYTFYESKGKVDAFRYIKSLIDDMYRQLERLDMSKGTR